MQFYITAAGVAAATAAESGGFKINVTNFQLANGYGYTPDGTETGFQGTVQYSGTPTQIYQIDTSTVMCVLRADDTVGPFQFGEIGIFLDNGTLFAIGVLPGLLDKTANTTSVPGNVIEFDAALMLTNIAAVINFPSYTGTQWGSITGILSNQTDLQAALNAKQNLLGFTPVQQGTGVGQNTNTVKVGWATATSRLKCTVDNTDLGNFVFDSQLAWNNISGKPSTFPTKWGSIGGVLAQQADLSAALAAKASLSGAIFTGPISATNLSGVNSGDQDLSTYLQDAPNNSNIYGRRGGTWYLIPPSAAPQWGGISGTLSNQADLQTALNAKANLFDPTFSGSPAAPTPAAGDNSTNLATTAFVQAALASLASSTSGSLKIGNILIQFGVGVAPPSSTSTTSKHISFPISYGSIKPVVVLNTTNSGNSTKGYVGVPQAQNASGTGFTAHFDLNDPSIPLNQSQTFYWIAIANVTAQPPTQS